VKRVSILSLDTLLDAANPAQRDSGDRFRRYAYQGDAQKYQPNASEASIACGHDSHGLRIGNR
jgi:hypothetical protein